MRNFIMNIKKVFISISVLCICSCNSFLDVVPDNIPIMDHAFRTRATTERYLFGCYSYLNNPGNLFEFPSMLTSRECWLPYDGWQHINGPSDGSNLFTWNVARGLQNANNPMLNCWDGNETINLFVALRDCNIFLENVDKPIDLEDYEKVRWIAEIKFLKAYYHFALLRHYGPIPVIRENLPVSASPEEARVYRDPVEDVAEYIVSLLDEAAPDLPLVILNETEELGRITKPAALALKAKVLTTMASPLFNGNPYYQDFKDSRGIKLFPTTEDKGKWEIAAQAIKEAIDCAETEGGRRLYTYRGFLPVSDSTRVELAIRGSLTEPWNEELIWASTKNPDQLQRLSAARTSTDYIWAEASVVSPTMDLVETFYSDKGIPIDEDKTYDYANRYDLKVATANERYFIKEGFETAKLHFNRENRFYASIIFDGGMLFGNGRSTDNPTTAFYIEMKSGKAGGRLAAEKYSITGYFPKKVLHTESTLTTSWTQTRYAFPYIRLADLYLLYAEALNEVKATPDAEVYSWIDKVRERANLKGVYESWTTYSDQPEKVTTQIGMRAIIHQERLIELAFEESPYWDILRWKEAEKRWNRPVRGWNVFGTVESTFYDVTTIAQSTFGTKDYFVPIKQSSLDRNANLMQNPGW